MLIIGELSSGILVACVPTLGPIFFPERFGPKKGVPYQSSTSRRPLRKLPSDGVPFWGPGSDSTDLGPYSSLGDEGRELQTTQSTGFRSEAYAGTAVRSD